MSVTSKLDGFQRRHPRAGFPIAVLYQYFDDGVGNLAALITCDGFLWLFPLLLMSTILGVVLPGDPHTQQRVLRSAPGQFPVTSARLKQPGRIGGGIIGMFVGGLGALGVAQAVQNAMNTAWAVPKNNRPNPSKPADAAFCYSQPLGLS